MSMNKLTVGDVAEIEELSNLPFSALSDSSAPKGKLMQAIGYVVKRKEDPKFTFADAGNLTMEEINFLLGEDPTPAA